MNTLQEVRNYLEDIPKIDHGGCGLAALAMYRWLKKNHKGRRKRLLFVYLYSQKTDSYFTNNKKILEGNMGEPTSCGHACIYYDGKYMDSSIIIDVSYYGSVQHITEEEFIKDSINNIGKWNVKFDRYYVDVIAEALDIDLSDIVKRNKDGDYSIAWNLENLLIWIKSLFR